jgi:YbbR domain-containing protein
VTWLRDIGLQLLIAFVLSLTLWVFVTITTNPDVQATYNNIPVDVQGMSPGLVIVDQNGLPRTTNGELTTVSAVIETDSNTLSELSQSNLQATVNMAGLNPGAHTVPVDIEPDFGNVRVLSVAPPELFVRLEEIVTRTVPLTVELRGNLPFSYERDQPEISVNGQPVEEVVVSGPRSQVERVAVAATTINLDQLRATYSSTLPLEALDSNGTSLSGVTLTPPEINVRIDIRSVVGLKRVPVLGNVVGAPASGYIVTGVQSDPPLINLIGNSTIIDEIDRIETVPIDISGATSTITREVPLNFGRAQPQASEPENATVIVQISPLDQPFQIQVTIPVQPVGAGDNLLVTLNPPVLQLTLRGTANTLAQLREETLAATVDVSGLGAGTYTRTPQLDLPQGIELAEALSQVAITLSVPQTLEPRPSPTPEPASDSEPAPAESPLPTGQPGEQQEAPPSTEQDSETPAPADGSEESSEQAPETPAPAEGSS